MSVFQHESTVTVQRLQMAAVTPLCHVSSDNQKHSVVTRAFKSSHCVTCQSRVYPNGKNCAASVAGAIHLS